MRLKIIALSGMPLYYFDIPGSVFFRKLRNFILYSSKKNVITAGKYAIDLTDEFTFLATIIEKDFASKIPNLEQALNLARFFITPHAPFFESKLLILFLDSEILFDIKQNKFYQIQIHCNNIIRFNAKQIEPPQYYSEYMHTTNNFQIPTNNIE